MIRKGFVLVIVGLVSAMSSVSALSMPSLSQPITSLQVSKIASGILVEDAQPLDDFEITLKIKRYFGVSAGPAWLGDTNIDALIDEAITAEIRRQGGSQAVNIIIAYEASMRDFMLNGLTGFIYAPSTIRLSGTVLQ